MKFYRSVLMDIGATLMIVGSVLGNWGAPGCLAIFVLLWNIRLNGGKLQYLHATPALLNSLKAHQEGGAGKLSVTETGETVVEQ